MRRCLNAKRRRELARDAALRQCIGRMDVARFDQERHRADGGPDRRRWKRCCPSAAGRTASCARRRRCCRDRTPALASAGLAPALASLRTAQWTGPGSSPIACRGAASSPNQRRRAGAGASGSRSARDGSWESAPMTRRSRAVRSRERMAAAGLGGDAEGRLAPGASGVERAAGDDEMVERDLRRTCGLAHRSTSPRMHDTLWPPTQIVVPSRAIRTRPARPRRVPCAAR
jgi:hypothetical protein